MAEWTRRTLKIRYGEDLRRHSSSEGDLGYPGLLKLITELFGVTRFVLKYRDEDGEEVTIAREEDWRECERCPLRPIRLFVRSCEEQESLSGNAGAKGGSPIEDNGKGPASSKGEEPSTQTSEGLYDKLPSAPLIKPLLKVLESVCPDFDIHANIPRHKLENVYGIFGKFVPRAEEVLSGNLAPEKLLAEFFSTLSDEIGSPDSSASSAPPPAAESNGGSAEERDHTVLHEGVTCDGCGATPIRGPRYKSLSQENFDLCASCEGVKDAKWNGIYVRIDKPQSRASAESYGVRPTPCRGFGQGMNPFSRDRRECNPHWRRGAHVRPRPFFGKATSPYTQHAQAKGHSKGSTCPEKLDARFVADVTVFDGTLVPAGQSFTKIWRLRNTGEVTWPTGTQMVYIGGDLIGHNSQQVATPEGGVTPGSELDVSIEMTAPSQPGRYVTYYRLAAPHPVTGDPEARFGQRFWALIQVVETEESTLLEGQPPHGISCSTRSFTAPQPARTSLAPSPTALNSSHPRQGGPGNGEPVSDITWQDCLPLEAFDAHSSSNTQPSDAGASASHTASQVDGAPKYVSALPPSSLKTDRITSTLKQLHLPDNLDVQMTNVEEAGGEMPTVEAEGDALSAFAEEDGMISTKTNADAIIKEEGISVNIASEVELEVDKDEKLDEGEEAEQPQEEEEEEKEEEEEEEAHFEPAMEHMVNSEPFELVQSQELAMQQEQEAEINSVVQQCAEVVDGDNVKQHTDELHQLVEMGFKDIATNMAVLQENEGNILLAVEHLMDMALDDRLHYSDEDEGNSLENWEEISYGADCVLSQE